MAVDAADRYNWTYSSPHALYMRGGCHVLGGTAWKHRERANPPPAVRQPQPTATSSGSLDAPSPQSSTIPDHLRRSRKCNVAATASAPNSGDRLDPTEGHAPSAHTGWNVCPDRGAWGVTEVTPPTSYHPNNLQYSQKFHILPIDTWCNTVI